MSTKLFTKNPLLLGITIMILITTVLFVFNSLITPRIKEVFFTGNKNSVGVADTRILVTFTEQMEKKKNINDFVKISPEVEFTTQWQQNSLLITFPRSLSYESSYTVTISKELPSIYNSFPKKDLTFQFTTEEARFIYTTESTINEYNLKSKSTKQIDLPFIFDAYTELNNTYAFLINKAPLSTEIGLLRDGKTAIHSIQGKSLYQIDSSPLIERFVVLAQEPIEVNFEGDYPERTVYLVDPNSFDITRAYPEEFSLDIEQFMVDSSGRLLLMRDTFDGIYYIQDLLFPQSLPVALGSFLTSSDINSTTGESLLLDELTGRQQGSITIALIDADGTKKILTTVDKASIDAKFISGTDQIVFSERSNSHTDFYSGKIMTNSGEIIDTIQSEGLSIELGKPSPNGEYIIFEVFDEMEKNDITSERVVNFLQRPEFGKLFLYSTRTKEFIDLGIQGRNVSWGELKE